ncbi:MAG: DNA mismatch repair endonuclease MutL, partial [Lachnospiraceae bacterium]|nr:DNA mismatch repair endonuclease MutL [Lachnospiraceae bacterium]
QIYGRDITANIVPFTLENEYINVSGFIGKPIISKGNRTFMNYFVNGRYVKSPIIYRALEEGYDGFHMSHKYPFCVLLFEADSSKIDVNVHPSKMEVRFSEGDRIYSVLCRGIKEALRNTDIIPEQSLRTPAHKKRTQNSLNNMSDGHAVDRQAADRNAENGASFGRRTDSLYTGDRTEEHKTEDYRDHTPTGSTFRGNGSAEDYAKDSAQTKNTYAEHRNTENIAEDGTLKKNTYMEKSHTQSLAEDNNEKRLDDKNSNAVKNMRAPEPFEINRIKSLSDSNSVQNPVDEPVYTTKNTKNVQMSLFERDDMKYESAKDYQIIGCVFSTYWIVQYHDEMYIMDQHAAHEKILYERLVAKMQNHETMQQQVSPPIIITLDAIEAELVKNNMEVFTNAGFEIEPFGGNEYAVSSVPADLPHIA